MRFPFGKGGKSTADKSGPSSTGDEKPKGGKSFSFKLRSKSNEKAPDTPAVAKKGWFGRKKYQGEPLADEEAPAAPDLAPAAEAEGLAASHGAPEPEIGGNTTSP